MKTFTDEDNKYCFMPGGDTLQTLNLLKIIIMALPSPNAHFAEKHANSNVIGQEDLFSK